MKASQKLKFDIEGLVMTVRFDELDSRLLPLVAKLEKEGDLFGPVCEVITLSTSLCVTVTYADKKRGPTKPTIFGFDSDEFMAKQY